jgi:hypothetical protein
MPQSKADEYRQQAQYCIKQAERANMPGNDKAAWLKMAAQWLQLAEDQQPKPNPNGQSSEGPLGETPDLPVSD